MMELLDFDIVSIAVYLALAMVIAYLAYKIMETESQVRKHDAKSAPYKVEAAVPTAPRGRKVATKKPAAKKTTTKRKTNS